MNFIELTASSRPLVEPPSTTIRDTPTKPGAAPRAQAPAVGAAVMSPECLYVNKERNSRSPFALTQREWRHASKLRRVSKDNPHYLLATENRILLVGDQQFDLMSAQGDLITTGLRTPGEVILNAQLGYFLQRDPSGLLVMQRLDNGQKEIRIHAAMGDRFARPYLAFASSHLVVMGRKILLPIERADAPPAVPEVILESRQLQQPFKLQRGYLTNFASYKALLRETLTMVVAVHDETILAATDDKIYRMSLDLDVSVVSSGHFTPLAMSLDELGRVYLIVIERGQNWLWFLSTEGERLLKMEIPAPRSGGHQPPIIGYDHSIIIPSEKSIVVISPDGRHRRDILISDGFAGAVVTADDRLLVADGEFLRAFDLFGNGNSRLIARFEGETLRTAPVMLARDVILVATDNHIHRLELASEKE